MKVAFYAPMKSPRHPTPSGDRSIARLIERSLQARGHEVILLSEFRSREALRSPLGIAKAFGAILRAYFKVLTNQPEAYFTYHVYRKVPDLLGSLLSWLTGRPYFIFEAYYSQKGRDSLSGKLNYWFTRLALKRARRIFTYKRVDKEGLLRVLPPERISFLPPAIDLKTFFPDKSVRPSFRQRLGIENDTPVIACTAMLRADRKSQGVRFLIAALTAIKDQPFELVIAGGGEGRADIQKLLQEHLPGRAHMLGAITQAEVAEMLKAADVFAFPGLDEGYGMVFLEAQACGLPVVAFAEGGIPEAVADGAGRLTPSQDLPAYSAALKEILGDAILREQMGRRGWEHTVARHDAEKFADALATAVEGAC